MENGRSNPSHGPFVDDVEKKRTRCITKEYYEHSSLPCHTKDPIPKAIPCY